MVLLWGGDSERQTQIRSPLPSSLAARVCKGTRRSDKHSHTVPKRKNSCWQCSFLVENTKGQWIGTWMPCLLLLWLAFELVLKPAPWDCHISESLRVQPSPPACLPTPVLFLFPTNLSGGSCILSLTGFIQILGRTWEMPVQGQTLPFRGMTSGDVRDSVVTMGRNTALCTWKLLTEICGTLIKKVILQSSVLRYFCLFISEGFKFARTIISGIYHCSQIPKPLALFLKLTSVLLFLFWFILSRSSSLFSWIE